MPYIEAYLNQFKERLQDPTTLVIVIVAIVVIIVIFNLPKWLKKSKQMSHSEFQKKMAAELKQAEKAKEKDPLSFTGKRE